MSKVTTFVKEFQHTAARRRLLVTAGVYGDISSVSTHSRPKAAASDSVMFATCCCWVSTHSRPKAAASVLLNATVSFSAFQHTAARRRLRELSQDFQAQENVSTHSRPKAAAQINNNAIYQEIVSTHSRPKAAAHFFCNIGGIDIVSTHSRPKAAAHKNKFLF